MNEIPITVTICDRSYKLTVKPEDEVIFRESANRINDRIKSYGQHFAFKDYQDLLAMVALQYTSRALREERRQTFREDDLGDRLRKLDELLSL